MPPVEKELLILHECLYIHPAWVVLFILSNYTLSRFFFRCCDVSFHFRVKTTISWSLLTSILQYVHILYPLFAFSNVYWCPTRCPFKVTRRVPLMAQELRTLRTTLVCTWLLAGFVLVNLQFPVQFLSTILSFYFFLSQIAVKYSAPFRCIFTC